MASCVLVIGNAKRIMCVGDNRAAFDLLARGGHFGKVPPYEEWRSGMLFGGDANGRHTVLRSHGGAAPAFVDLTFGHIALRTNGAIEVPPAFAAFGEVAWPAAKMGDVWFQYAPAPEPPDLRNMDAHEWSGLIDDLATLADIALSVRNHEQMFAAEMQRQVEQLPR